MRPKQKLAACVCRATQLKALGHLSCYLGLDPVFVEDRRDAGMSVPGACGCIARGGGDGVA